MMNIIFRCKKTRIRPVWVALENLCTTRCVALGVGARAPTREGSPKHATGTCAGPSQLRASEFRLRGALACKAPSAPTPSATITCADVPLRAEASRAQASAWELGAAARTPSAASRNTGRFMGGGSSGSRGLKVGRARRVHKGPRALAPPAFPSYHDEH